MKLLDLLNESISFNACTIDDKMIRPHNMRKEEFDCSICDGKGENEYSTGDKEQCGMCYGTGKVEQSVCDGPELNVSNANARSIVEEILGKEFDYSGYVRKTDLVELRKHLFIMVNSKNRRSAMHKDSYDSEKDRKMAKGETKGNVTSIGKQGPRMIDGGRTDPQVLQYAKTMLEMVEYAMKHNLVISWA